MMATQRGFGLPGLWLGLSLGLLLVLILLQLYAGLQRSARAALQWMQWQQQERVAWSAIEHSLSQLGGRDLPAQTLQLPLSLTLPAGQALAAGRLGDGALVLLLRQRQRAGSAASGCLGGGHSAREPGDWIAVDALYVRGGALLCQPLAYRATDFSLVAKVAPQALVGSSADPFVLGWELEWGVAESNAAAAWHIRPALPLPPAETLRSLHVQLWLRGADGQPRRSSRVFALPP